MLAFLLPVVELGDAQTRVRIELNKTLSAAFPLLIYRELEGKFFCRLSWSLGELDETRLPMRNATSVIKCRISISAESNDS
jgi:hypothetical protein